MPNFSVFLLATLALAVTPGPDTLYVLARSLGQGRAAGIVSVLGICVGLLVHIVAAAAGLSALLMTVGWAYGLLKVAGAVYLIYLGVRMLLRAESHLLKPLDRTSLKRIFSQGILSSTLNPKLALFFLAFLPQFVDPDRGDVVLQTLILGGLFALIGAVWLMSLALLTSQIGGLLQRHPGLERWQQRFTGGVLVGLGLHLALPEQR